MQRDQRQLRGRHLWAKSAETGPGHSLLAHLLDVGLIAEALLTTRGDHEVRLLADELGLTASDARRLTIILVALHDIGKATPVFQAKWPPGAPAEALERRLDDVQHGRAGGILLRAWLCETGVHPRVAASLANAVAIHHGNRVPANFAAPGTYDPRSLGEDELPWKRWRSAIFDDVLAAFGPLPTITSKKYLRGRSWTLLAGITSVSDWLGSSFPHVGEVTDIAAYLEERRLQATQKLEDVAWPSSFPWWREPEAPESFGSWFVGYGESFVPRPLQEAVAELVAGKRQPSLLIIEAPMGEGKTEAAFYAMVQPNGQRGGYIALPTQATSDAMHERLTRFVHTHQARHVDVALAHGTAGRMVVVRNSIDEVDPVGSESQAIAESWFSGGRRELLAELGAGTVDQALLGVLPARHFFVRLWGLAGKVVIFDEVHAYDAYTGGLIVELTRWLGAVGSSVVLMSATLPTSVRQRLIDAYCEGSGESAPACPELEYPRLLRTEAQVLESRTFAATKSASIRLERAPYDLSLLADEIVAAAKQSGAVAAVVNNVGRAQRLYELCRERFEDVTLLHARMPLEERKRREGAVVHRFGPDGAGSGRCGLVIATQVVEQSLDLDFDTMFTDLAPVDLLLQRSGRMHRHARPARPTHFASPVLRIAGLHAPNESGPDRDAVDTVYDALIMWRTWAVLTQRSKLLLPADIDALVQLVYSEESLSELRGFQVEVDQATAEHRTKQLAESDAAKTWSLGSPLKSSTDSWGEAGRDDDDRKAYLLRVPTRLGNDSVSAVPIIASATGWRVHGVDGGLGPTRAKRASKEFVDAVFARHLRISRKSLVARLRSQGLPAWWVNTGGLRHYLPLVLDEESVVAIDRSVRLDDELGLVYEKGGPHESA